MHDVSLGMHFDSPDAATLASDADLWSLYESSFPSREREPRTVILASVGDGAGFVQRARLSDVTVGMAFVHLLRDPPAGFLVYLAVAKEHRSRRVGAALFEQAWRTTVSRQTAAGRPPVGLVWEVERLEDAVGADELEQRRRRISFFERCGAVLLDVPYLQPAVDRIAAVPMRLMFLPAAATTMTDATSATALIRAIYFEKYLARNEVPREELDELLSRARAKKTRP